MEITVNGEKRQIDVAMTVAQFLRSIDIGEGRVAVELNRDILPKGEYDTTILTEGDVLEIVHFVGGGR